MVSHLRRAAIGLLGLYWLALFVGTHIPVSMQGIGHGRDKALHFLAFAGLAFLMSLGIGGRRPTWRVFVLVLLAASMYAVFDEFSQLLVGRRCEFWDWVADCIGTGTGLFVYWVATVLHQSWLRSGSTPKAGSARSQWSDEAVAGIREPSRLR